MLKMSFVVMVNWF